MTIRTILVSIDGSETTPAILDTAFMVAKRLKVHVDVLHVRPDSLTQVPAIGDGMSGAMADKISAKIDRKAADRAMRARAVFEDTCARLEIPVVGDDPVLEGPSATWIERVGRKHKVMIRLGRVHDLMVLGHPNDPKDLSHSLTVKALFETGRPVLMAPRSVPEVIGRRIAVAWNGSAECARALGGATNFFKDAEEVVILTAHSDRTPVSVVPELEHYLKRHGIKVETRVFTHLGKERLSGRMLFEECAKASVDMLVMGAYRVGRIKRLVLGSATRDVLALSNIPVLMGH